MTPSRFRGTVRALVIGIAFLVLASAIPLSLLHSDPGAAELYPTAGPSGVEFRPMVSPPAAVSPDTGPVGANISVSGSGFGADANVSLMFGGLVDGVPILTDCVTGALGQFPTSGADNCSFAVPYSVSGPTNVSIATSRTVWDAVDDNAPYSVVYDRDLGELFVPNYSDGNVSVINDTTGEFVTNISVGNPNEISPEGGAYDPVTRQVFVASGSANVSVIDAATATLVANVSVGGTTSSATFDPTTGQIYVTNLGSDNVSLLSEAHGTWGLLANLSIGSPQRSAVYDPYAQQMFVTDELTGNVTAIDGADSSVIGNVSVGTFPWGMAYDPVDGDVFVANVFSDSLSILNGSTDTAVATISVGNLPVGLAVVPSTEEVLVVGLGPELDVVSISSGQLVGAVDVPQGGGFGIVYDNGTGDADIAERDAGEVLALDGLSFGWTSFTVVPSLVSMASQSPPFGLTQGGVEGDEIGLEGNGFAANSPISFRVSDVVPPTPSTGCATNSTGSFGEPPGYTTSCDFSIPALPAGTYNLSATDGAGNVANTTLIVNSSASILPNSGGVGTEVLVAGTGFPAGSSVTATLDGASVPLTCSADATGNFPGASGTACTFAVPSLSPGPYAVDVSDGTISWSDLFNVTSLSTAPTSGAYGNAVTVSGSGLDPGLGVNFSLGGFLVPSSCLVDGLGELVGSAGGACTLSVPSAPQGADALVATQGLWQSWSHDGGIGVGLAPIGVALDPSDGKLFVTNSDSNTVSVVSTSEKETIATIPVGNSPAGIAYAGPSGQVFVANAGSDNVSILSATEDTVTTTVTLSASPEAVVYDPGTNEVFVANNDGSVTLLNASTDAVVTTVETNSPGVFPLGAAYDPATGEIFITSGFDTGGTGGAVSVVWDSNNTVGKSIFLSGTAYGDAYDPATGQLFVGIEGTGSAGYSGYVDVIDCSNDSIVASIPVPAPNSFGMGLAYDPAAGGVILTGTVYAGVSLISDSTDSEVDVSSASVGALGLAYDPASNAVYVANYGYSCGPTCYPQFDSNVSVMTPTTSAATTFDVSSAVQVSNSTVDANTTLIVEGDGFAADEAIASVEVGSVPLSCLNASSGRCHEGSLSTDAAGSFVADFVLPATVSAGTYTVTVTDGAGNSATAALTVVPDPEPGTISANRSNLDVGQSVTLSVGPAQFGLPPYQYHWVDLPLGCTGTALSFSCSPVESGHFNVTVIVTDASGASATSAPFALAVLSDPTVVSSPGASPASGHVDAGQSVTFTAAPSGGTGTYVNYVWTGLPGSCAGSGPSVTCSAGDLPAGNFTIAVSVTDSNGYVSAPSPLLRYEVDSDPTVSPPVASRSTADVGQTVGFGTTASQGSGGAYRFNWSGLPQGCASSISDQVSCAPTTPGDYAISVTVTDANGFNVTSTSLEFRVYSDPTVAVLASPASLDLGQSLTLTAETANGSGGFAYDWSGLPTGCESTGPTVTCTATAPDTYYVTVSVKDSNGESATSSPERVTVAAAVTASMAPNVTSTTVGSSVTFTAVGSGGTGPLSYDWSFGDGTTGTGATVTHSYASPGNFTVTVWVNDTVGGSSERSVTIDVSMPTSSAPGSGSSGIGDAGIGAIAAVLVVIGVVGAVLLLRRRKTRDPTSPAQRPAGTDSRQGNPPAPTNDESVEDDPPN